ncbi:DHH family phosphoesterase [Anaeromicropila herbilytica]|uniref:1-pyrroline-5-carboxylate dehydrogenase n=1 Tax=Anaeromicropila herbilytica TaxID=2785025 RepID=A0A7R7EM89_9FIRM|nr:bifunctional oligoribonuclease/PAP phosphatase NrnA [Anaeromicropila herbilytica]BCN31466.1 1-pyrroline-5-carboxylate dehydrogenase [Anaeromicropila herbilytica]
MDDILLELEHAKKIGITGHIRPDGDCIGSCLSLYQYIKNNTNDSIVDVYLEYIPDNYNMLEGMNEINHDYQKEEEYDVFITLDCGSIDRIGKADKYFTKAKKTICIDHHISNQAFADVNHIVPDASSTCEILFGLMREEKINKSIAEALYTGIIYDTGVFKHSNTTEKTMNIAGKLICKGINFSKIIDESFYQKTYIQNQLLGRCLLESFLVLDKRCIITSVSRRDLEFYNATTKDLDGIIDQLRVTKGIQVAVFIHELDFREYKVSMRSNEIVNVSKIASFFGGGGHIKAAGFSMKGSLHDVINNVTRHIEAQLNNLEVTN